jgi:hypothetical protein
MVGENKLAFRGRPRFLRGSGAGWMMDMVAIGIGIGIGNLRGEVGE